MPGVAVAVTGVDGAESVLVVGHADLAGTPLRSDHLLQIGSISKSFAAICALQLEAEGACRSTIPWSATCRGSRSAAGTGRSRCDTC